MRRLVWFFVVRICSINVPFKFSATGPFRILHSTKKWNIMKQCGPTKRNNANKQDHKAQKKHNTLRKHAYSDTMYNENFTTKKFWYFFIFLPAQNKDCGYSLEPPRRGGSNEYHNLCFGAEIRKIMYTHVNPSFTIQKWGLRGRGGGGGGGSGGVKIIYM